MPPRTVLRLTDAELAEMQHRSVAEAQQLVLPGVQTRRRKATMTVAELRAQQPEKDIRAEIIAACHAYPAVAWIERCEPYHGYILPFKTFDRMAAYVRSKKSWPGSVVVEVVRQFLVVRKFARHDMPDLIGQLRSGPVLALEVKRPGEEPTKGQVAFLHLIASAGGCAAVVHDAHEAIERIRAYEGARRRE